MVTETRVIQPPESVIENVQKSANALELAGTVFECKPRPHPSGQGFTYLPESWVDKNAQVREDAGFRNEFMQFISKTT